MTAIGLKIIGVILTVGSGCLCGIMAGNHEQRRILVLDGWIELIDRIRSDIDLYLRPLDEILAHAPPALLLRAGGGKRRTTLHGILLASAPYLSKESERRIGTLLTDLGNHYHNEQIKRCDEQLCALNRELERMRGELPARLRLCRTASTCLAAGIAILLW